MTTYCIFETLHLKDAVKFNSYKKRVGAIVKKYNGRYMAPGGRVRPVEGRWEESPWVIIAFPDFETVNAWHDAEEYRELKALRMEGIKCNAIIVEGFDEPSDTV